MLTLQWENLASLLDADDFQDKLVAHWVEVGVDSDNIQVQPDWDKYLFRQSAGAWKIMTARENDTLVGFMSFHFFHSDRHPNLLCVSEDLVSVFPIASSRALVWVAMARHAVQCAPRPCLFEIGYPEPPTRTGAVMKSLGLTASRVIHRAYLE